MKTAAAGAAGKPGGAVAGSCIFRLTVAAATAGANPGGGGTCRPGAMMK